ncbi:MAG: hypothetical protein ACREAB_09995 [Blastocatellia bacterium]
MKTKTAQDDEVIVEVTREQYQAALARGLEPEETLAPGTHKFIRGGFLKRHPNFDPATAPTTIYIRLGLDQEVLEYFKRLAEQTGADSYETPIKRVLREAMEKGKQKPVDLSLDAQAALLDNPQFIEAVAERVKKTISKKAVSKKAAPSTKPRRRAA